jgi:hypothetical protein
VAEASQFAGAVTVRAPPLCVSYSSTRWFWSKECLGAEPHERHPCDPRCVEVETLKLVLY